MKLLTDRTHWKSTLPFQYLDPESFSLELSRSIIKLHHDQNWSVNKVNTVYDLFCCLEGSAEYTVGDEHCLIKEGDMVLIEPEMNFTGRIRDCKLYTGFAQHFSFRMFDLIDFFSIVRYRRKVSLQNWEKIKPVMSFYRESTPLDEITYQQICLFQAILVEYAKQSFIEMKFEEEIPYFILETAAEIEQKSAGKLPFDKVVEDLPYSKRYLDEVFKKFTGKTIKQFWTFKKIQRAEKLLHAGVSVKETSYALGFADPLYFSRLFKCKRGFPPSEIKQAH